MLNKTTMTNKTTSEAQKLDLNEWLDEIDKLRAQKRPSYYTNPKLGEPKYDNGIDQLFTQGMSPQEALRAWKSWRGAKKTPAAQLDREIAKVLNDKGGQSKIYRVQIRGPGGEWFWVAPDHITVVRKNAKTFLSREDAEQAVAEELAREPRHETRIVSSRS